MAVFGSFSCQFSFLLGKDPFKPAAMEELRALGPKLDAVEADIQSASGKLSAIFTQLSAGNLEDSLRNLLLDERTRLKEEVQLLHAKEDRLNKDKESLLALLLVPKQPGAGPLFCFKEEKINITNYKNIYI